MILTKHKNKVLNLPIFIFIMRKLPSIKTIILLVFTLFYVFNSFAQTEGTIKVQSNESIKQLVAKKRAYNKNLNHVKGYKIQLFYGSEQGAKKIRQKFSSVFTDVRSELKFNSPDWKVWVGAYKTELEADKALVEIKEGFPGAIKVPAKIKI